MLADYAVLILMLTGGFVFFTTVALLMLAVVQWLEKRWQ